MTKVVHCNKAPFSIYIGRGSKWGNPFSHLKHSSALYTVKTRKESIDKHREWIKTQPELMAALHELKDHTLGCFCKPLPCHGDTLASLADSLP